MGIKGACEFERVVEMGFFCLLVFTNDPWIEPVRGLDRFQQILRKVEARHCKAREVFIQADFNSLSLVSFTSTHPEA